MKKYTKNSLVTLVTVSTALATVVPSVSSVVASANTHHVKSHKVVKTKKKSKFSHKFKYSLPYNYKKKHKNLVGKVMSGPTAKVEHAAKSVKKDFTRHFGLKHVKVSKTKKNKKLFVAKSPISSAAHKISSWFHHKK